MPKAIEDLKFGDTIIAVHITGKSRIIGVVGRMSAADMGDEIAAVHPQDEKLFVLPPQPIAFLDPMPRFEHYGASDVNVPQFRIPSKIVYTPTLFIGLVPEPTLEERQAEAEAIARAQAQAAAEAEAVARARATAAVEVLVAIVRVCVTAATTQLLELDSGPRAEAPEAAPEPLPLEME